MIITAPVSRSIAVTNIDKSVAFYRDMLGFEASAETGVVLGPARVEFVEAQEPPPRAILFFQTGDVVALHTSMRTLGAAPSQLEKMNLLKIEMFEIRDPDGHALWFGQPYQQPDRERPSPLLEKALPDFPLSTVTSGVAYYRDVLGFNINYQQHDLAVMDRDRVTVLLSERTHEHKGIGSAYIYIRDADALHRELTARGANVLGEPVSHPWGLREFEVRDLEGNRLKFGQPFE